MDEIIHKISFIKIKNFHSAVDSIKGIRSQAPDWEKIFEKTHLIKDTYWNVQRILKTHQ